MSVGQKWEEEEYCSDESPLGLNRTKNGLVLCFSFCVSQHILAVTVAVTPHGSSIRAGFCSTWGSLCSPQRDQGLNKPQSAFRQPPPSPCFSEMSQPKWHYILPQLRHPHSDTAVDLWFRELFSFMGPFSGGEGREPSFQGKGLRNWNCVDCSAHDIMKTLFVLLWAYFVNPFF